MRSTGGPLRWLVALLAGIVVGVAGYLLMPLPIGPNAGPPSAGSGRSAGSSGTVTPSGPGARSVTPSPGRGTPSPAEESPPFTRSALLQPDEFRGFGWGKAEQTAIADGAGPDLATLCARPGQIAGDAVEAYSAEYRGLQTEAIEIVVRQRSSSAAAKLYDRVGRWIADCAAASRSRRAEPTRRHDPLLTDVQQARWWQVDVPAGSGGRTEAARAAVAVARIDDRLVYLMLISDTTDPSTTVQYEALLTQAARRLV